MKKEKKITKKKQNNYEERQEITLRLRILADILLNLF